MLPAGHEVVGTFLGAEWDDVRDLARRSLSSMSRDLRAMLPSWDQTFTAGFEVDGDELTVALWNEGIELARGDEIMSGENPDDDALITAVLHLTTQLEGAGLQPEDVDRWGSFSHASHVEATVG